MESPTVLLDDESNQWRSIEIDDGSHTSQEGHSSKLAEEEGKQGGEMAEGDGDGGGEVDSVAAFASYKFLVASVRMAPVSVL